VSSSKDNYQNDLDVIKQCMDKHLTFQKVMANRVTNVKMVMNFILRNNDLV
jgi:hypothetical protein